MKKKISCPQNTQSACSDSLAGKFSLFWEFVFEKDFGVHASAGRFSLGDSDLRPVLCPVLTLRIDCSHFGMKIRLKIDFKVLKERERERERENRMSFPMKTRNWFSGS
jgi:hypothetical protein